MKCCAKYLDYCNFDYITAFHGCFAFCGFEFIQKQKTKSKRKKMGEKLFSLILEFYSEPKTMQKLLKILRKLVDTWPSFAVKLQWNFLLFECFNGTLKIWHEISMRFWVNRIDCEMSLWMVCFWKLLVLSVKFFWFFSFLLFIRFGSVRYAVNHFVKVFNSMSHFISVNSLILQSGEHDINLVWKRNAKKYPGQRQM